MPARVGSGNLRGALRVVARLDNGGGVPWSTLSSVVHFETLQRLVWAGALTSTGLDPAKCRPRPGVTNPVFHLTRFGRQILAEIDGQHAARRVYLGCAGRRPAQAAGPDGSHPATGRPPRRRRPESKRHRRYQPEQ
jgi:hypothetical protein